jgi:glutamyl-tRNA reductase
VTALREHGNEIVEQILAENAGRWESASERDLMRVEAVARAVLGRLLHEPTIRLRSFSQERGHASLQLVRELFGLDEEPQRGTAAEDGDRKLAEVRSIESARKSS